MFFMAPPCVLSLCGGFRATGNEVSLGFRSSSSEPLQEMHHMSSVVRDVDVVFVNPLLLRKNCALIPPSHCTPGRSNL